MMRRAVLFYITFIGLTLLKDIPTVCADLVHNVYCKCTECEPGAVTCRTDGVCFSSVLLQGGEKHYQYKCVEKKDMRPGVCTSSHPKAVYNVSCCNSTNYCNGLNPATLTLPPTTTVYSSKGQKNTTPTRSPQGVPWWVILVAVVGVHLLIASLLIALFAAGCLSRKCKQDRTEGPQHGYHGEGREKDPMVLLEEGPLDVMMSEGLNKSGSFFGHAILVHRTIAQQTQLGEIIGKGRFGEVRRGRWHGEDVAVKIFMSREEESWKREMDIYNTKLLRHENLLGYIAADNRDSGTWTQLLLLTDYHANGSLFDYLNHAPIDTKGLLRLAHSTVSGLAHLHLEIRGMEGKPAIAHRDIKSKNILVKENGTACIADLGLAVRYFPQTKDIDKLPNDLVGTKRYMAPEVLDRTINTTHFESFKKADMYALGLVLWELTQRTEEAGDEPTEYHLPYHDMVLPDPSFDDMRLVVCERRQRPRCPTHWEQHTQHKMLSVLATIMKECWYQNPDARLSALHVKEQLNALSK